MNSSINSQCYYKEEEEGLLLQQSFLARASVVQARPKHLPPDEETVGADLH